MKSFPQIRHAARERLRELGQTALGLLYPPHCSGCGADTEVGFHLCAECRSHLPRLRPPFCQRCSEPFAGAIDSEFVCATCREHEFPFQCAVAAYRTGGLVSAFIHRFKYRGHFFLRHPLAEWLAEGLADPRLRESPIDFLVPVPLHPAREREREFNQSEVLGEMLAESSGLPMIDPLQRIRFTGTQTALDRVERMENLRGAFRLRQGGEVTGRHLLLLDDVFTTGSTVEECARVLMGGGAASVRVLTVARAISDF